MSEASPQPSMQPRWSLKRIAAAVVSAILLALGATFLWEGHQMRRSFERWQTAKPFEGAIDLSRPGTHVFPFEQTCSISHGEKVWLLIPSQDLDVAQAEDLLTKLDATLEISNKLNGEVVVKAEFSPFSPHTPEKGRVPLFMIVPFRKGSYIATLTVIRGAPPLQGIPQTIEGRYELCGLELMPAQLGTLLGILSTGLGGLAGLLVMMRVRKHGKGLSVEEPQSPVSKDTLAG